MCQTTSRTWSITYGLGFQTINFMIEWQSMEKKKINLIMKNEWPQESINQASGVHSWMIWPIPTHVQALVKAAGQNGQDDLYAQEIKELGDQKGKTDQQVQAAGSRDRNSINSGKALQVPGKAVWWNTRREEHLSTSMACQKNTRHGFTSTTCC